MRFVVAAVLTFCWSASAPGGLIYESASLGPVGRTGGFVISDGSFLGSRFSLDSRTHITGIGGHIYTTRGFEPVFGAIIPLSSPTAFPSFDPFDIEQYALASALFASTCTPERPELCFTSEDMLESVDIVLPTGDYALIFGSDGLLGADGTGAMTDVNIPLPGATFFGWSVDEEWIEVPLSLTVTTITKVRFVVEGVTVPEPSGVVLFAIAVGLLTATFRRRFFG